VQPREAAIRFWLDPIPPEEMPMLAAQMLAEGHDAPALRRALGTWDFDDVIYPGLPGDLKDLVLMCHLLGTEHYAPNGGDERLLAAARALAARSR